jgi:hypothetical protein
MIYRQVTGEAKERENNQVCVYVYTYQSYRRPQLEIIMYPETVFPFPVTQIEIEKW